MIDFQFGDRDDGDAKENRPCVSFNKGLSDQGWYSEKVLEEELRGLCE